ncbi:MAG: ATP-binding protein [Magnetococcus sp. YQC-9]
MPNPHRIDPIQAKDSARFFPALTMHPAAPALATPISWLPIHGMILLLATSGVLCSVLLFFSVRFQIDQHLKQEFEWVARDRHRAVNKSLGTATNVVQELGDLFSSTTIDEAAFQRIASQIRARHPGIKALQWVPLTVSPADPLTESAQVAFSHPSLVEPFACGHDHYADPAMHLLLEEARDSGSMVVSRRIRLAADGSSHPYGFLVALPIYPSDVRSVSVLERHSALTGYVIGLFQFAALTEQAIAMLEPRGVECIILDDQAQAEERFLHFYASRLTGAPLSFENPLDWRVWIESPEPKLASTTRIGNRLWSITCSQTSHFRSAEWFVHGHWMALLAGLFLTSILTYHLWRIDRESILRTRMAHRLEESEQLLSVLFHRSPDTIRLVDRSGHLLMINRPSATLATSPADPLIDPPEPFQKAYRHALEQAIELNEVHHLHQRTRDDRWFEIRIVPLRAKTGTASAMVVSTDISAIKLPEEQAAKHARLAALGLMAAGVAHEINNPNNSIYYNASLLADAWPTVRSILDEYHREQGEFALAGLPYSEMGAKIPQIIGWILDNTERIKKIVELLKNLARNDEATLKQPVDLARLAQGTLLLLNNTIQTHTERFEHHFPADLPQVAAHPQQLEQVLINILVNALQSLPDRSHGVRLEAIFDEANREVILIVRDEGCGMPPALMEKITEPFFTTRLEQGGTGLGLSISASIIKNHGGRLRFESQPGIGTTVFIHLPSQGDSNA